jgi:hypothetical protein
MKGYRLFNKRIPLINKELVESDRAVKSRTSVQTSQPKTTPQQEH